MSLHFLSGEEEDLCEHKLAWMTRDDAKIKELADSYKEKPESELFATLNDLNACKVRNLSQSESYSPFYVNDYLSNFPDCLIAAYTANLFLSGLSNQCHYNYMIHSIKPGKRYVKKEKLVEDAEDLFITKLIQRIFNVNVIDAKMYKTILTEKGILMSTLGKYKALVTDDLLKSVTKNVPLQKKLSKLL